MSDKITSFTDLLVWKEGHKLVLSTYELTSKFPREEIYGLSNQMQRASVSITSNLAEGFGMRTYKDKVRFYYMAQGSINELKNQLLIAKDLKYIQKKDFDNVAYRANSTHRLLLKFIKSTEKYKKNF